MADQCLGNRSIDPVHGHVVSVISGPAQSKLGHISGSDHKPSYLIGNIHQDLGTLSGLSVFVGYIMAVYVLSNILKMACNGLADIDFLKGCPYLLCHHAGVGIGTVRSAEAGHGNAVDLFSGKI